MKKKFKNEESAFTSEELESKLRGLTPNKAYVFTKRDNSDEFQNILSLANQGFVDNRINEIESVDFIYSGDSNSQYLLTLTVGRNDTHQSKDVYDYDVYNICENTGSTRGIMRRQWLHFKDNEGERLSFNVSENIISDEIERKDKTYNTILSGSTGHIDLDTYKQLKPKLFDVHRDSFKRLKGEWFEGFGS